MVSTATRDKYESKIKSLKNYGIIDFNDFDNVICFLEHKYNNTGSLKTFIVAIIYHIKQNNPENIGLVLKYTNKLSDINKTSNKTSNKTNNDNNDNDNNNNNNITLNDIIKVRDSIVLTQKPLRKYKNDLICSISLSIFIDAPKIKFSSLLDFFYHNSNNYNKLENCIVLIDKPFIFYRGNSFDVSSNLLDILKIYISVFRLIDGDKLFNDMTEYQFRYLILHLFEKNNIAITFSCLNSIQ